MKRWWIQPFIRILSAFSLPILVPVATTFVIFAMPGGPAEIICPPSGCGEAQFEHLAKQLHVDKGPWNYFKHTLKRAVGNQEKKSNEFFYSGKGEVSLAYQVDRDATSTQLAVYVAEDGEVAFKQNYVYQYCSEDQTLDPAQEFCFGKDPGTKRKVDGKQIKVNLKAEQQSFVWHGLNTYGGRLPEGLYRYEIVASDDSGPIEVTYTMPTQYSNPDLGTSLRLNQGISINELVFGTEIQPEGITLSVANAYDKSITDIRSTSFESNREAKLLSMWFMSQYTDLQLLKIGRLHGIQDLATIQTGLSQMSKLIETDQNVRSKAKLVQDDLLNEANYHKPALDISLQMLLMGIAVIALGSLFGVMSIPKPKWDPLLIAVGVAPILFLALLVDAILTLKFNQSASIDTIRLLLGGLSLGLADGAFSGAITGVRGTFDREKKQRYVGVSILRGERTLSNTIPNIAQSLVGQFRARVLLLLSGLVIVEVILNTGGLGELLWKGTLKQDFAVVLVAATFFAIISSLLLLLQALVEIGVALHVRKSPKGVVMLQEAA